jgi:hypothetical protein
MIYFSWKNKNKIKMAHEKFWLVKNSLFVQHYEWIIGVKYFIKLYELRISFFKKIKFKDFI